MFSMCPECDAKVELENSVVVCEVVVGPECAAELEVITVDPPELAVAPQVEEDWGE